jgi:Uma2 family endonuclease
MTSAIFGRGRSVTEEEFLALDEISERVELFDWSLNVTPAPTPLHQYISGELFVALRPAARKMGLYVLEGVNVRLQLGRIPIPDLIISEKIDYRNPVIDASAVRFVCEIVSPSNAATDKVLKMHYYATAGIPWYLLIEQDTGALHLHELIGNHYVERSVTKMGEALHLTDPVDATLYPADLLPPD